MLRLIPFIFLIACGPYRYLKKDYITLSESPCVDGTILNIDQAGCEGFYWGTDIEMITLKIRCAYAPEDSFWTKSSFYAVPHDYEIIHANWKLYCQDKYVKMYSVSPPTKLEMAEDEQ